MYQDFRRDLLVRLNDILDAETLRSVIDQVDLTALNYSISKMTTDLTVRGKDNLEEYGKLYSVCKKVEGCSDATIANYALTIKNFINYVSCPLEEITANTVRKYLLLYKMDHDVKDISLDRIRQNLAGWFVWMQNEGYITKNPMASIAKIKFQKTKKPSINQVELEHLRDVCHDDRERCLVEVLYSTGCRISEALNIKYADIRFDLPQPECKVVGKGKKVRTVYFSPRAVSAIRHYMASRSHESEWLFVNDRGGAQMKRGNAEKIFRQLRHLAGLEEKSLTPHTMRHTMATQTSKIAPIQVVQQLLGHSKIDTTMRYVETNQDDAKMYHARSI